MGYLPYQLVQIFLPSTVWLAYERFLWRASPALTFRFVTSKATRKCSAKMATQKSTSNLRWQTEVQGTEVSVLVYIYIYYIIRLHKLQNIHWQQASPFKWNKKKWTQRTTSLPPGKTHIFQNGTYQNLQGLFTTLASFLKLTQLQLQPGQKFQLQSLLGFWNGNNGNTQQVRLEIQRWTMCIIVYIYVYTLEVQPPFFKGWFPNHHYFSRGLSSSKRNHHF